VTTAYAHRERLALAELLREVGPDAPTLCEGWTTRDLVAHLLVRERRPDAAAGVLIRPLAGYTERVLRGYAERDYEELLAEVVRPPWWSPVSNPLTDELVNTMELFLHHEDVRRAQPEWQPRTLPAGMESMLWRRVSMLAAVRLRGLPNRVTLVAPSYGERSAGTGTQVHLTGAPSELLLFVTGRQRATRLNAEGPQQDIDALYEANLSL
jgi:uncharacterized protein (TIGR03085 family)